MGQPAFFWCEYSDSATVTATDSAEGADASDILYSTDDLTHSFANATGTKTYTIDLAASTSVTALAILGEGINGESVEVRGSTDNFVTSDVQLKASTALIAEINAAYLTFTGGSYRYIKLNFNSPSTAMQIAHVCLGDVTQVEYFEEDWDAPNIQHTGDHTISDTGYYLGSNVKAVYKRLNIVMGDLTSAQFSVLSGWRSYCVDGLRPFFVIPDQSSTNIYFGWQKDFSAPESNARRSVAPFEFTTRAT